MAVLIKVLIFIVTAWAIAIAIKEILKLLVSLAALMLSIGAGYLIFDGVLQGTLTTGALTLLLLVFLGGLIFFYKR